MTAEAFCQSAFPKYGPFMLGSPIGRMQNHHVIFHTVYANPVVSFLPLLLIQIIFIEEVIVVCIFRSILGQGDGSAGKVTLLTIQVRFPGLTC